MEALSTLLTERTRIVALTHVSNVLGVINPVEEVIRQAHNAGAIVLLDAAQSVPHIPVDVQALDCDFLAFSGHKMLAPMGIGVLYGKHDLLEAMPPFLGGGNMIMRVELERATYNGLPDKFEAGTPDVGGAIALGVAVDYLTKLGMANVQQHEQELVNYAYESLTKLDDVEIYGPKSLGKRVGVISFNLGDVHPHDLGTILDREGIAIRAGHHCAQPLMKRLGQIATARASFYIYNKKEEIDALVLGLLTTRKIFE
jgi:cysteine desulfurase/selenocysteine lyase